MNILATQKVELHQAVNRIADDKLQEAQVYLQSLARKNAKSEDKRGSLEGMWEGTGLEDIDFEDELKKLRR